MGTLVNTPTFDPTKARSEGAGATQHRRDRWLTLSRLSPTHPLQVRTQEQLNTEEIAGGRPRLSPTYPLQVRTQDPL